MKRLESWRLHASCRKEAVALKKRLARAERAAFVLAKSVKRQAKKARR